MDILAKMREWIEAEVAKAKRPYQDPFELTSLAFAAEQAAGKGAFEQVRDKLWLAAAVELFGTYDVMTPREALRIIERASF